MFDSSADLPDYREVGALGVVYLKRLWTRMARQRHQHGQPVQTDPTEASLDKLVIYGVGLGLLETLRFLSGGASFEDFERWILAVNGGALDTTRVARLNATVLRQLGLATAEAAALPALAPALDAADLEFWEANGYVVLHDAVNLDQCRAAEAAIWESLGAAPHDPGAWYGGPQGHSIWLQLINHPALDAIRQSPRIHAAFAQLWGTPDVWATVDRAGFNPPEREGWRFPGPHLHWDTSLAQPMPFGTQGILYLTDTAADQGAFTCVPGFHHRLEAWLSELRDGDDPRQQDLYRLGPVPIAGRAGDLIIWHHALPHGSSPNRTNKPRMVQYISMFPPWYRESQTWI